MDKREKISFAIAVFIAVTISVLFILKDVIDWSTLKNFLNS